MAGPKGVKEGVVDAPWYPADVRAGAMEEARGPIHFDEGQLLVSIDPVCHGS